MKTVQLGRLKKQVSIVGLGGKVFSVPTIDRVRRNWLSGRHCSRTSATVIVPGYILTASSIMGRFGKATLNCARQSSRPQSPHLVTGMGLWQTCLLLCSVSRQTILTSGRSMMFAPRKILWQSQGPEAHWRPLSRQGRVDW